MGRGGSANRSAGRGCDGGTGWSGGRRGRRGRGGSLGSGRSAAGRSGRCSWGRETHRRCGGRFGRQRDADRFLLGLDFGGLARCGRNGRAGRRIRHKRWPKLGRRSEGCQTFWPALGAGMGWFEGVEMKSAALGRPPAREGRRFPVESVRVGGARPIRIGIGFGILGWVSLRMRDSPSSGPRRSGVHRGRHDLRDPSVHHRPVPHGLRRDRRRGHRDIHHRHRRRRLHAGAGLPWGARR